MSKRPSSTDPDQSVTESADDDPFLSRWARRKRTARAGGDPDAVAGEVSGGQAELAIPAPTSADMPAVVDDNEAEASTDDPTDDDMPPVESINEDTDMSGFFSPKVSQALKKAALKKFFHSPMFNIVDGLDDYDDDFRNFEALGDIITSDMRTQMERKAKRAEEEAANDAGGAESPESMESHVETADEVDEVASDDVQEPPETGGDEPAAEQLAAAEPGVTREPGAKPQTRQGKLRSKGAADDDQ